MRRCGAERVELVSPEGRVEFLLIDQLYLTLMGSQMLRTIDPWGGGFRGSLKIAKFCVSIPEMSHRGPWSLHFFPGDSDVNGRLVNIHPN